jgi:hypothetical protein
MTVAMTISGSTRARCHTAPDVPAVPPVKAFCVKSAPRRWYRRPCPHLEVQRAGGPEQSGSVECRDVQQPPDFRLQLREFGVQTGTVAGVVRGVRGLDGEFPHTLKHVTGLAQRTFSGLGKGDGIVGIADGDRHATGLGIHALRYRKSGCIVLRTVDAQT